jgi:hypothetical protein
MMFSFTFELKVFFLSEMTVHPLQIKQNRKTDKAEGLHSSAHERAAAASGTETLSSPVQSNIIGRNRSDTM